MNLTDLGRPYTPAAVGVKPQTVTQDKSKGLVTYYIDARLVAERLNAVVGLDGWADEYDVLIRHPEAVKVGIPVECRLTVAGVTRRDVGQITPGEMDDKAWKSAYSDAFKRAAVKFRIGAYLYSSPNVWCEVKVGGNGKVQGFSDAGRRDALAKYAAWIGSPRVVELYGAALDHGDVDDGEQAERGTGSGTIPTTSAARSEGEEPPSRSASSSADPVAVELLAVAKKLGSEDAVSMAVAQSRTKRTPEDHAAWLQKQLAAAQQRLAEKDAQAA